MTETFDIVVVGAGTSGVVTALAAARQGARVALVEAGERAGGLAAHGLHRYVCGLFLADGEHPGEPLHGASTRDFCSRLAQGDVCGKAVRRGRVWVLPFAGGAALTACAGELLSREANIRTYLRDAPERIHCDGGKALEMVLASGLTLRLKAAVDCTGSAAVCRLAGAAVTWPSAPALAGYGFELQGVEEREAAVWGLSVEVPLLLRREVEEGRLPHHLAFSTYEPGMSPGSAWIKLAVPAGSEEAAKREAASVRDVLKRHPAFRNARVAPPLPAVLERETCHLDGEYVLTGLDVLTARKFDDGAVRNAWPVEHWDARRGVSYRYLPPGDWCDIPARCLRPKGGPANLLCAGAALSADSEASASIRVMGVCMASGEAAAQACVESL
jgi:hypothetical protein